MLNLIEFADVTRMKGVGRRGKAPTASNGSASSANASAEDPVRIPLIKRVARQRVVDIPPHRVSRDMFDDSARSAPAANESASSPEVAFMHGQRDNTFDR